MNVLLIDDEAYILKSIQEKVCWDHLPVQEIYTANSVEEAKRILTVLPVQIVVSDIVMPGGTGLEFADWVRKTHRDVQIIFLTSYAEFDFIKRAMELEGVDYLLKPMDYEKLEASISKAIERCRHQQQFEVYKSESQKWNRSKRVLHENFLKKLLMNRDIRSLEEIEASIRKKHLDYTREDRFLPLLISVTQKNSEKPWDAQLVGFVLRNTLEEILSPLGFTMEAVFQDQGYFVILRKNPGSEATLNQASQALENYMDTLRSLLEADLWCGFGSGADLQNLRNDGCRLRDMWENTISVQNCVLILDTYMHREVHYQPPDFALWKNLLAERKADELISLIYQYLSGLENNRVISHLVLKQFRMDMIQMVYSFLSEQEIIAHQLFSSADSEEKFKNSVNSVAQMRIYTRHLIQKGIEYTEYANQTISVVEEVKKYIDIHYKEDIRRSTLASLVYLNEDYLSRIFKKKTGVSISTYLIQRRIEVAQDLLVRSNLPINTVSLYVGYSNFSYFTKIFRESTGCSPLEYRRKMKQETN